MEFPKFLLLLGKSDFERRCVIIASVSEIKTFIRFKFQTKSL